jgi:hypothetical protein
MRLTTIVVLAALSASFLSAQNSGWLTPGATRIMKPASSSSSSDTFDLTFRDKCDPVTFNATIGPGTCIGNGNVTFPEFLTEFLEDGSVGAWRYNPSGPTDAKAGQYVTLDNRGGEAHTFTPVINFGGGFVDALDAPNSGVVAPAPECVVHDAKGNPVRDKTGALIPNPDALKTIVPANTMMNGPRLPSSGEQNYQCCIHPWMHLTVKVQDDKSGKGK